MVNTWMPGKNHYVLGPKFLAILHHLPSKKIFARITTVNPVQRVCVRFLSAFENAVIQSNTWTANMQYKVYSFLTVVTLFGSREVWWNLFICTFGQIKWHLVKKKWEAFRI